MPFLKETSYLGLVMFAAGYVLIIGLYSSIVFVLFKERRRKKHLRAQPAVGASFKIERRVAFTLLIVIVIFSACWFPMIVVFFAAISCEDAWHCVHVDTIFSSVKLCHELYYYSARIRDFRVVYALICRKILQVLCLASSDKS